MIVAYREGTRAVFLHGFAQNERENLRPNELDDLRAIGCRWLQMATSALAGEIDEGRLQEVKDSDKKKA